MHIPFDIVAGDLDSRSLVYCPSVRHITLCDIERLHSFVAEGGTLFISLGAYPHGFPGADLVGANLLDFSLETTPFETLRWGSDTWSFDWSKTDMPAVHVQCTTGEVIGYFNGGAPGLIANPLGKGLVIFCPAPFEQQLDAPGRLTSARWERLYVRVCELAGITPAIHCDNADVEITYSEAQSNTALLINHCADPVVAAVRWGGDESTDGGQVRLDAKGWSLIAREDGQ